MPFQQHAFIKERLALNLARLKKAGQTFEVILKDVDSAIAFRQGKADVSLFDCLNPPDAIFTDAKQGDRASSELLLKCLGTKNVEEAAKIILTKGEVQLTSEQRDRIFESRKRKILEYIHQNAVDPKTGMPHPLQRIELALEQAKAHIDPTDKLEWQIENIIPKLQPIIPLSFVKVHLKVNIPTKYAGSAYSNIKNKYAVAKDAWLNDGSVQFELTAPAGLKVDIFNFINRLTKGEAEIEELRERK